MKLDPIIDWLERGSLSSERREAFIEIIKRNPQLLIAVMMSLGFMCLYNTDGCDNTSDLVERRISEMKLGGKNVKEVDGIQSNIPVKVSRLSVVEKKRLNKIMPGFTKVSRDVLLNRDGKWWDLIREYNLENEVFFRMLGLMRKESNFRSNAVSHRGAKGLVQLMPYVKKEIVAKAKLDEDATYLSLTNDEKDVMIGYLHFEDRFGFVNSEFAKDGSYYEELWEELISDEYCFKNIVLDIFITGYNQGAGRTHRLLKYLIDLHKSGLIPKKLYVDGDEITNLRPEVIAYIHNRAYNVVVGKKEYHKLDSRFSSNNLKYGEDGRYYNQAVEYNALFIKDYILEGISDKVEAKSNHSKISKNLNRINDELYEIGSDDYKLVYNHDLEGHDEGLIKFDINQVKEESRRGIPQEFSDLYLEISSQVKEKTGEAPILNSSCRDKNGVDRTSDKKSFHKWCQAFDWKVAGIADKNIASYKSTLVEYAIDGRLYFKHENKNRNGEHIHVVFVSSENIEEARKDLQSLSPLYSTAHFKYSTPKKTKTVYKSFVIKDKLKHCKQESSYRKNKNKLKECVSLLEDSESSLKASGQSHSWRPPSVRKSVITSIAPNLKDKRVVPGKRYKIDGKSISVDKNLRIK